MFLHFLFFFALSEDCHEYSNEKYTTQLIPSGPINNCFRIIDCFFDQISTLDSNGGAILMTQQMEITLHLTNSIFHSCSSTRVGGCLYLEVRAPYIDGCCFIGCSAVNASVMYAHGDYHSSFIINFTTMAQCKCEYYSNYVFNTEFTLRNYNGTKMHSNYASIVYGHRAQFFEGLFTTFVENSDGGEIAFFECDIQHWFRWFNGNFVNNTYRDESCYLLTASTSWLFWDSVFNGNGDHLFDIIDTFACHLIRCYFDCVPDMKYITLSTWLPGYDDVYNTSAPTNPNEHVNTFECIGYHSTPTASSSPSQSPSETEIPTPSETPTESATPKPSPKPSETPIETPTVSQSPTPDPTPTASESLTPTKSPFPDSDDDNKNKKNSLKIGVAVGAIAGAFAAGLIIMGIVWFACSKKRMNEDVLLITEK